MNLQSYVANILTFANNVIIPFFIGLAFLFFIINVIRFFVAGGNSQEGKEKARALATYSILALVFISIFWGIVNLFVGGLGFTRLSSPTPDYVELNSNTPNCDDGTADCFGF